MRACIYGAGSLGIVLGAFMQNAGIEIDLINRNEAHVEALRAHGARVEGTVQMAVPVNALTPGEMRGAYDVAFLLTKQLDNDATVRSLLPYLGETGIICTLQNGLPEPGIAAILGADRVLGCAVEWGATLKAPGVSELTSSVDSLSFGLGALTEKGAAQLPQVQRMLEAMCPVTVEENFLGVRWAKLLINSAFSGMSAVMGCTFGEAAADPLGRRLIQRLVKECIDVSGAEGVRIAKVQGKDIVRLLDYRGPIKRWVSERIIPIAIKKHAKLKASMLQDIEKGKKTEVDAINGVVAARGRQHGIGTPYNDCVIRLVHEIEAGTRKPGLQNAQLFP